MKLVHPLMIAVALFVASFGCDRQVYQLTLGSVKKVSPIELNFDDCKFLKLDDDAKALNRAKGLVGPLLIKEVLIDSIFRDPSGALWLCDTRDDSRYSFQQVKFSAEELAKMTQQQIDKRFGFSALAMLRRDGIHYWYVFDGESGKALRASQVVAEFGTNGEVKFVCVNTGRPR